MKHESEKIKTIQIFNSQKELLAEIEVIALDGLVTPDTVTEIYKGDPMTLVEAEERIRNSIRHFTR